MIFNKLIPTEESKRIEGIYKLAFETYLENFEKTRAREMANEVYENEIKKFFLNNPGSQHLRNYINKRKRR